MPKSTPLMTPPTKKANPKPSNFFQCMKTCVFSGFEQLSISIAQRIMELQSGMKTSAQAGFWSTDISYTGAKGVNVY